MLGGKVGDSEKIGAKRVGRGAWAEREKCAKNEKIFWTA